MRVRAGWAMILLVIAALEFVASFRGVAAPVVFVLAVVAPFGIVRLGRWTRLGTFPSALLSIVLVSAAAWAALRGSSTNSFAGLGDAVPRLLTTARPAVSSAALLAAPALLVALIATVVAACVLAPPREESDPRSVGLLAPVIGAVMIYTAAQLLAAGTADRYGAVAVSLLVVIVAGWSMPYLRGNTQKKIGERPAWRPAVVAPVLVVGLLALGIAALAGGQPFDPRRHVTPPTVRLTTASPLSQLSSWSANPSATILQTTVTGTSRLHLATLDTFTGASWNVDARYQQLGLVSAGDLPAGRYRTAVSATVRIVRLAGVWLPAPGRPTSSSLDDVLVDPNNGTLARPQQARPGLRYDVSASIDAPSNDQLSVAALPTSVPKRYLDLPGSPAAFAEYARAAVRGASTPLEEAVALENAVSTNRRLDASAPTGSSYGRLSTFLFGTKGTAGAQVGTDEQFAAAFAVLAREVGLPTRLTVGFSLGKPATNGTITVRGSDATVWPEVYFADAGWVPFAPSPDNGLDAGAATLRDNVLQRLSDQAAKLPPADPPIAARPTPGATAAPSAPRSSTNRSIAHPATGVPGWLVAVLVGVGVLAAVLAMLVGLRRARLRRHRRAGAIGAWAEVEDLLVLLGRRPPVGLSATRVAADLDASLAPVAGAALVAPATAIASAADRAAFAPPSPASGSPASGSTVSGSAVPGSAVSESPVSGSPVSGSSVSGSPVSGSAGPTGPSSSAAPADVWRDVRILQRRARASLPRRRRIVLPIDPRPLLRRR